MRVGPFAGVRPAGASTTWRPARRLVSGRELHERGGELNGRMRVNGSRRGTAVVLTHGDSPERAGSARSAAAVRPALRDLGWDAHVVDLAQPAQVRRLRRTDLAFVAGHGWYSEDGKLQGLLEVLGVPYTGSGVLASAIAMHKPSANSLLRQAGLRVPSWRQVDLAAVPDLEAKRLVHDLGLPVFVKPVSGGGSIGAGIARDRIELAARVQTVGAQTPMTAYMAAEYVDGADLSVGLIELHGELVTLPILAVEHDGEFYDYTIKHNVALRRESCPADLPPEVSELVGAMAKQAFAVLHCHGVARVDFVIDDRRRPWLLEVNTAPGLSEQGNLATMARAAGLSYTEMIEAVALTAFSKRGYRL